MIFEDNIKKGALKGHNLLCKCGSIRYSVEIFKDDNNEYSWILLTCKKCGKILYYNGA